VRRRFTTTTHNPEAVWQINRSIKKTRFFRDHQQASQRFPVRDTRQARLPRRAW
jgi:hypothetical protein